MFPFPAAFFASPGGPPLSVLSEKSYDLPTFSPWRAMDLLAANAVEFASYALLASMRFVISVMELTLGYVT